MTVYTLCFDFPELEGTPMFASANGDRTLTLRLAEAKTFNTEADAEHHLEAAYRQAESQYGVVVEVAQ